MREVRLYGHLGKKFGRSFKLDVKSPAEAIQALKANFPDFESYMRQFAKQQFVVRVGKTSVDESGLTMQSTKGAIRITPVIAGSGTGGVKMIVGAVLIVAGVFFQNPYLITAGISMMVGGAVQLLMAPPKSGDKETGNKPSYAFNGPVNTTAQGNVVPICYGQMLVGSQVVSAGLSVEQIAIHHVLTGKQQFIERTFKISPWDDTE